MTNNLNKSVLNPYDVLGVSPSASKAEIVAAKIAAMKRKQYPLNILAEAEKNLLKPEKRIIADYTRPILQPVKRWKKENFTILDQPAPKLIFLSQFDGIDLALAQSIAEESLEQEILTLPKMELLPVGIESCKQKRYPEAIQYLEEFIQSCAQIQPIEYPQAQMWLANAYQNQGELEKALLICQDLVNNDNIQISTWAKHAVNSLEKSIQSQNIVNKLKIGLQYFQQKNYLQAIPLLEEFCQICTDVSSPAYLQAQITLVKAYYGNKQISKALILCQKLRENDNIQVQNWANKTFQFLSNSQSSVNT